MLFFREGVKHRGNTSLGLRDRQSAQIRCLMIPKTTINSILHREGGVTIARFTILEKEHKKMAELKVQPFKKRIKS